MVCAWANSKDRHPVVPLAFVFSENDRLNESHFVLAPASPVLESETGIRVEAVAINGIAVDMAVTRTTKVNQSTVGNHTNEFEKCEPKHFVMFKNLGGDAYIERFGGKWKLVRIRENEVDSWSLLEVYAHPVKRVGKVLT